MAQTNIVTVSGMFGDGNTYLADSPVVITVEGLQWPASSPFCVVRVKVLYGGKAYGEFPADTGGQPTATFDISTALKAIWAEEDFGSEAAKAKAALSKTTAQTAERPSRAYSLNISTEYISSDGVYTETQCADRPGRTDIPAGKCVVGGMTEWERSLIADNDNKTAARFLRSNLRFGGFSTKPTESPEHVGDKSITSWVGFVGGKTTGIYYPASTVTEDDDPEDAQEGIKRKDGLIVYQGHAPVVLRDSQEYVDFLFLNRRGAVETCSGLTKEAMDISVETKQYGRVERPTFKPSRSVMALGSDGRRSWNMSSGYVTREWAEWWATEFLGGKRKRWWMRYPLYDTSGTFVPVIVEPAKKSVTIYDRTKQNMPHVDFTVTLALEG